MTSQGQTVTLDSAGLPVRLTYTTALENGIRPPYSVFPMKRVLYQSSLNFSAIFF